MCKIAKLPEAERGFSNPLHEEVGLVSVNKPACNRTTLVSCVKKTACNRTTLSYSQAGMQSYNSKCHVSTNQYEIIQLLYYVS